MGTITRSLRSALKAPLRQRDIVAATLFLGFLVMAAACIGLARSGSWLLRADGSPGPTDFLAFWASSELILHGEPLAPYDADRLTRLCNAHAGQGADAICTWLYPPHALFLVAPLGLLPFLTAWMAWTAALLAAFAWSLWAVVGRLGAALALGLPATFVCVSIGQNGLLTAALMAGTLVVLDRRPWVAGVILGLLTYKPQFGLLFPLVLAATWRWRPATAAAVTAIVLAVAAELAFGPGGWAAFLGGGPSEGMALMDAGIWDWRKLQSVFGMAKVLGAPHWLAMALHGVVALLVVVLVTIIWRRPCSAPAKASALVAGTLLLSPYIFMYEAPLTTVAIAFLLRDGLDRGFLRGDRAAIVVAAAMPLIQFATYSVMLPFAAAILLWAAIRRSAHRS